jgi:hypothetical protein
MRGHRQREVSAVGGALCQDLMGHHRQLCSTSTARTVVVVIKKAVEGLKAIEVEKSILHRRGQMKIKFIHPEPVSLSY